MKHIVTQPHAIFSVENSPYPEKIKSKISHEDAIQKLKLIGGGDVHSISGHYGSPEKSIFVSNPSEKQIQTIRNLAHETGQESHIESTGKEHSMLYGHGPQAGKIVRGTGTVFHEKAPKDYFSTLGENVHFTHNFDFNKSLDKAIHSPSKHIPLSRLKQIKQDNYIGESGKEFSQEELDQAIHERGESQAKNIVREAEAREKRIAREMSSGKGGALPPKLKKALSHEELKNQGYRFTILKPTKTRDAFAVRVYHGKKAVGHLAFSDRSRSYLETNPESHKDGYHSVFNSHIEEPHRGKGIYQHMLKLAAQHAKSLGSKGILSEGNQRSSAASRAWDKVATHAGVKSFHGGVAPKSSPETTDYFLAASEMEKGARGDWKKEGYKISHSISMNPKVDEKNYWDDHDHTVTVFAHDKNNNLVGKAPFFFHPRRSSMVPTGTKVDEDHRRKGLATAMYQHAEKIMKKPILSDNPGGRTQDAEYLWSQPNRPFGKSNKVVGGKGDKKSIKDFNPKEVEMGRKVEMEHTSNPKIAEEILSDHLTENPRYYSKLKESGLADELNKMSRPRITFPNLKDVSTRPDQEIQVTSTPRQKKLFGRKVANINIRDQKNVPYTQMLQHPDGRLEVVSETKKDISRQQDRSDLTQKIARQLGSRHHGEVRHTKLGPRGAAAAGDITSYAPERKEDEAYQNKVKEHVEKRNALVRDYNKKYIDWRNKGWQLSQEATKDPTKKLDFEQHMINKPEKPKLPRKPSKPKVKVSELSPESKMRRDRALGSTIEHEGFHYSLGQIANKYGAKAYSQVMNRLVGAHDPSAIALVSSFITKRMKYSKKSPSFKEELIAHARDILVNPIKRESFVKFIGDESAARDVINKLKAGHQKAYQIARDVRPEDVGADTGKLAASESEKSRIEESRSSWTFPEKKKPLPKVKFMTIEGENPPMEPELEKGVKRRLFPTKQEQIEHRNIVGKPLTDRLFGWQKLAQPEQREALATSFGQLPPNTRKRALLELHAKTAVRKNPKTGETEFLLHRGIDNKERSRAVDIPSKAVFYDKHSSWTPLTHVASEFHVLRSKTNNPNKGGVISAWIPESKIATVPKYWGDYESDTGKGPNKWKDEHEVIIHPGDYDLVHNKDVSRLTGKDKHDFHPNNRGVFTLDQSINARGAGLKPKDTIQTYASERKRLAASELSKAKEDKLVSEDRRKDLRQERSRFSRDPLEAQLTSRQGVSDRGIEVRRGDTRVKGAIAHGYGRVSSPEKHKEKARAYFKEVGEKVKKLPKLNLTRSEDMEKGARGDWKKEGYTLEFNKPYTQTYSKKGVRVPHFTEHTIVAKSPNGEIVGKYVFNDHHDTSDPRLYAYTSMTHSDHQRKGLATAAYRMIENHTKKKLTIPKDPDWQSEKAKALWSQPNRPFGKSQLTKAPVQFEISRQTTEKPIQATKTQFAGSKEIKSVSLPNGLIYRHSKIRPDMDTFVHELYHPDIEQPLAQIKTRAIGEMDPDVHQDHMVSWAQVHPEHKGKGLGRQLYNAVLAHGHNVARLMSDYTVSSKAQRAWENLKGQAGTQLKLSPYATSAQIKRNPYKHADAMESQHMIQVKNKKDLDHRKMFPEVRIDAPKKMAASEMEKGAARRLYGKFDPLKELGGNKKMSNWVSGNYEDSGTGEHRQNLPDPSSAAKIRMTNKLSNRAKTRFNSKTKQREFLLHRQMSQWEFDKHHKNGIISHSGEKDFTSWTPFLSSIVDSSGIYPKSSFDANDKDSYNTIVSAWVPESHVKTIPIQYGRTGTSDPSRRGASSSIYLKEQEVIVKPNHNSEVHSIYKDSGKTPHAWDWKKIK